MKTLYIVLLVGYFAVVSRGDEHTELKNLQRDFFLWRMFERHMKDNHGSSDRLESFTQDQMTERMTMAKDFYLDRLKTINTTNLSEKDLMDYRILLDMLESYIKGYDWRLWTNLTPMSWLEGLQRNPTLFVNSTPFYSVGDFENYIAKLWDIPRLFRECKELFNEAIRLGRTSHIKSIDRIPKQIEEILNSTVAESVYYSPFIDDLNQYIWTVTGHTHMKKGIRERGYKAVEGVFEAYRDLKDYLENVYMKHTRPSAGVGALEGGADFYKACLNWYLSIDKTPEEIHQLGLDEIKRVEEKMHEIIHKQQGFKNCSIREYFAKLKERDDMFFETEEDVINEYQQIILRIEPHLSKLFRDQPGLPVKVESMPTEGPRGQYISGSSDGLVPGLFYANTFRRVPKYVMTSLAMHEANPGHHLQISYALTADHPDFRKNRENNERFRVPFAIPSYTAFMEGWALYAESLGVEAGIYEKDYELMGYYESEIFRAARLVVDTGLHYYNWTRDEAIDFFLKHTAESKDGVIIEVDRYITWPGQATAYKIGELWIRELRKKAEREHGKMFDVREFHMAVLENGGVPLRIMEEEVNKWIRDYPKQKAREMEEEDMDGQCECIPVPRSKPKVRCKRKTNDMSPYQAQTNRNSARCQANVDRSWIGLATALVAGVSLAMGSRSSVMS